jgi:hypothetical protein
LGKAIADLDKKPLYKEYPGLGSGQSGMKITDTAFDMKKALETVAKAFDGLSRVAEMSGHKTVAAIASIASTTIKAFAQGGPIAAAIAFVTSTITAFADVLFKTENRAVNDLRDAYIAAAGGFTALVLKARAVGVELGSSSAFQAAKTEKQWQAASAALDSLISKTKELDDLRATSIQTWDTIGAIVEKYGLDLTKAGDAVKQLSINATARTLLTEWQQWEQAVGDTQELIRGMAPSVNELVNNARQLGSAIPENMRPMIEAFANAGKLLDKAGQPIDISTLVYGPAIETEVEKNIKALEALTAEVNALRLQMGGSPLPSSTGASRIPLPAGLAGVVAEQDARMGVQGGSGGVTVYVTNQIKAWDGQSVDAWLQQGGAQQLAEGIVSVIPGVVSNYGLV